MVERPAVHPQCFVSMRDEAVLVGDHIRHGEKHSYCCLGFVNFKWGSLAFYQVQTQILNQINVLNLKLLESVLESYLNLLRYYLGSNSDCSCTETFTREKPSRPTLLFLQSFSPATAKNEMSATYRLSVALELYKIKHGWCPGIRKQKSPSLSLYP